MITSKFGEHITYFHNKKIIKNDIATFVKNYKFIDFSPEGITSYLTYRYPIGNATMFAEVKKIPFGKKKENTFWYPKFGGSRDSLKKAIKVIEELLFESLRRLTEDLDNPAVALSGGIDSSLITAMLRKLYPYKKINTYCTGFYGEDEFEYARIVSKENNTIHKEILLTKDDFIGKDSIISKLIEFKGSPLHPNEIPLAILEKIAKQEGMEIVLCGEGADDIFGGYGQNFRMYLNYNFNDSFFKYFLDNYRYFSLNDRNIIKSEYLVDDFDLTMKFLNKNEIDYNIRNWAIYFTQKLHTPGLITRGANAMRFNGFPLGFPYIDNDLVNYVNSLPFEYKVAWKSERDKILAKKENFRIISEKYDIPKMILKKLAEKYLSHKIIYRQKKGFPVPFHLWLKDLREWKLNKNVFKSNNISNYSAWKKFMIINLNTFLNIFKKYKK